MKKNIIYIAMACLALGFTACSDDPEDAVEKHVYGPDDAPYLRTDLDATIAVNAEFRKGHVAPKIIKLKDYAEQIQIKMKMTVDDMLAKLETGEVVFYNINPARGIWNKAAATKGSNGWWYNTAGVVSDATNGIASIELDKSAKALILSVPEESAAGVSVAANVGFAVNNGKDYDNYIRFNVSFAVTDPGTIICNITIPEGDYASYELEFESCEAAISAVFGMTVAEFCSEVSDTGNDIAMYIVDDAGNWNTSADYTANGIGYWCEADGTVRGWGDGCAYFIETHAEDKTVGIGRYPGLASGTEYKVHFVYVSKSDASKFIEFVINATLE
ncbi:MAG: DUF4859 domain-containing protein [Prevotella sp.]|nr:DUF4859 domain-containing protein [Prevotella sp.]